MPYRIVSQSTASCYMIVSLGEQHDHQIMHLLNFCSKLFRIKEITTTIVQLMGVISEGMGTERLLQMKY